MAVAALTPLDRAVLTSGVYRYATVAAPGAYTVPFYRDGRTATVSVRRHQRSQMLTLATNGKPDASLALAWIRGGADTTPAALAAVRARQPLSGDQVTQALLPILALAHAPRAASAAVIGQGSGMTSHLLLGSPHLRSVATIDIEPEMIRGSRFFYPANRRVFDDPRSRFVTDDAKAYFASAHRTFDVIVSEPSNPWVSGVSGLFTDEFYARVRSYLAPGGVFGQWLHLYEIDDRLVLSVLAAVHRHFPAYTVYMASRADIFVVATTGAAVPAPDWTIVDFPGLGRDLARTPRLDAATLDGLRLADRRALAPLLDRWRPINSDFHPVLDLGAERTRFLRRSATGLRELHVGRFDPIAAMRGWQVPFADAPVAAIEMPRAEARARAAAVRLAWQSYAPDGVAGAGGEAPFLPMGGAETRAVRDALYRRAVLEQQLAGSRAPADWHHFVRHALDVEDDLHAGTAGVVDSAFYARVEGYLGRAGAPREAVAAVRFARGLAGHDWPLARAEAAVLLAALGRDDPWVRPELLHDGGVVAALRVGDAAFARQLYAATAARTERTADEMRSLLLAAWIAHAGGRDAPASPASPASSPASPAAVATPAPPPASPPVRP